MSKITPNQSFVPTELKKPDHYDVSQNSAPNWEAMDDKYKQKIKLIDNSIKTLAQSEDAFILTSKDVFTKFQMFFDAAEAFNKSLIDAEVEPFKKAVADYQHLIKDKAMHKENTDNAKEAYDKSVENLEILKKEQKDLKSALQAVATKIPVDKLAKLKINSKITYGHKIFKWVWSVIYMKPKETYTWDLFKKSILAKLNGTDFRLTVENFDIDLLNPDLAKYTSEVLRDEDIALADLQVDEKNVSIKNLYAVAHLINEAHELRENIKKTEQEIKIKHDFMDEENLKFRAMELETLVPKAKVDFRTKYITTLKKAEPEFKILKELHKEREELYENHSSEVFTINYKYERNIERKAKRECHQLITDYNGSESSRWNLEVIQKDSQPVRALTTKSMFAIKTEHTVSMNTSRPFVKGDNEAPNFETLEEVLETSGCDIPDEEAVYLFTTNSRDDLEVLEKTQFDKLWPKTYPLPTPLKKSFLEEVKKQNPSLILSK